MSVRLYVGNLPKEAIERQALEEIFAQEPVQPVSTKLIKDKKTGKCRGFAFVTVVSDDVANEFIEKFNGLPFMESNLKIEKAQPRIKGKDKDKGEEDEEGENEEQPKVAIDVPKPVKPKSGTGNNRRNRRKEGNNLQGSGGSVEGDAVQADPRWAGKLAELKEKLLTAQSANP